MLSFEQMEYSIYPNFIAFNGVVNHEISAVV